MPGENCPIPIVTAIANGIVKRAQASMSTRRGMLASMYDREFLVFLAIEIEESTPFISDVNTLTTLVGIPPT